MISLQKALMEMDTLQNHRKEPTPFSIVFFTANRSKKTGGEKIEIRRAVLSKRMKEMPRHMKQGLISATGRSKAPNHYENSTRNIYDLDTDRIYTIHIRLIKWYNSQEIVW